MLSPRPLSGLPKMVFDFFKILCGALLAAGMFPNQVSAQMPGSKVGSFPERLLDATDHFDLALTLQGDLRGNYGPCG